MGHERSGDKSFERLLRYAQSSLHLEVKKLCGSEEIVVSEQILVKSACNVADLCSIPGLGRSPREGKGYALQYSGLENSMDCIVHGVAKSLT